MKKILLSRRSFRVAAAAVLVTGALTGLGAEGAQASGEKCVYFAATKDLQGHYCIDVTGSGLHTSSIEGSYDGIPTSNTMELFVNGSKVESWAFSAKSSISHIFSTGKNKTWPGTTAVHLCVANQVGAGPLCTDDQHIYAS